MSLEVAGNGTIQKLGYLPSIVTIAPISKKGEILVKNRDFFIPLCNRHHDRRGGGVSEYCHPIWY